MSGEILLAEAERLLAAHSPATFDTSIDGFPNCIEFVRRVEDEEGWRDGYPSLEAFYDTQAARHPDVRLYARVRRDIATSIPVRVSGRPVVIAACRPVRDHRLLHERNAITRVASH